MKFYGVYKLSIKTKEKGNNVYTNSLKLYTSPRVILILNMFSYIFFQLIFILVTTEVGGACICLARALLLFFMHMIPNVKLRAIYEGRDERRK